MKLLSIILLISATLLQARPTVKRAAFPSVLDHSEIQKYAEEKNFEQLCKIINWLQNLLMEADNDNDLNILGEGLENLKQATQNLDNFHCQVPIIVTLITSTIESTSEEMMKTLQFWLQFWRMIKTLNCAMIVKKATRKKLKHGLFFFTEIATKS